MVKLGLPIARSALDPIVTLVVTPQGTADSYATSRIKPNPPSVRQHKYCTVVHLRQTVDKTPRCHHRVNRIKVCVAQDIGRYGRQFLHMCRTSKIQLSAQLLTNRSPHLPAGGNFHVCSVIILYAKARRDQIRRCRHRPSAGTPRPRPLLGHPRRRC